MIEYLISRTMGNQRRHTASLLAVRPSVCPTRGPSKAAGPHEASLGRDPREDTLVAILVPRAHQRKATRNTTRDTRALVNRPNYKCLYPYTYIVPNPRNEVDVTL